MWFWQTVSILSNKLFWNYFDVPLITVALGRWYFREESSSGETFIRAMKDLD